MENSEVTGVAGMGLSMNRFLKKTKAGKPTEVTKMRELVSNSKSKTSKIVRNQRQNTNAKSPRQKKQVLNEKRDQKS